MHSAVVQDMQKRTRAQKRIKKSVRAILIEKKVTQRGRERGKERGRESRVQLKFWMGQRLFRRAYFGIAVTWNEQLCQLSAPPTKMMTRFALVRFGIGLSVDFFVSHLYSARSFSLVPGTIQRILRVILRKKMYHRTVDHDSHSRKSVFQIVWIIAI